MKTVQFRRRVFAELKPHGKIQQYCWWFRNPAPVDMVDIPVFTGFQHHPKWLALGFLNHQQ